MKLTLSNINSRYASVAALNANFQAIVTALENTLSRDGTSPNTMSASLDMNSQRIINVADPVNAGDVATKGWMEGMPDNAAASAADAEASAAAALASEVAAEAAADTIVGWDFVGQWTTATAYVVNNIVSISSGAYQGWSFICIVAHTSGGTFATDYSGGKWEVMAQRGAAGAGTGDMLAANNLSDVASTSSARTNLGLGSIATQSANSVSITGGSVTGVTDIVVADGGTGASSITANSVILGNGTSPLSGNLVAPSTSGNLLTSNGTTWTSAAPTYGAYKYNIYTSGSTTWTCPAGVTRVKVIVVGGGGASLEDGASGGTGGYALGIYTVTPTTGYAVTVGAGGATNGASGATSSFSSLISATGGSPGTNGAGSSGNIVNGTGAHGDVSGSTYGNGGAAIEGSWNAGVAGVVLVQYIG